ncbi:MAG TPA: ABC transporter substrate-binding protein [Candidatus Binatia bacterium]|jgi:NitT/TauT family transport system substrate-binding protein
MLRLLIAGAFLLSVVCCSSVTHAKTVKLSVPAHSISHVAFYVAKEKGFYRDEGLDVDLILMNAGVAVRALIGGDVDFTTVGTSGVPAILRGAPLKFYFLSFSRPIHWLYARPEIKDVKALRGRKVATSGIGSASDVLFKSVLKSNGLEGGQDLTIVSIGVASTRYAALISGSVDATPLTFPHNFMAEQAGFRELVNFTKTDLLDITGSIIAPDALFRSDPATVERFTRATLKGFLYARENRAGTIPILARNLKVNDDRAAKILDMASPAMTSDGTVSKEAEKRIVDDVIGRVGLKEAPSLDRVFNFSLVRKIRGELDAAGWNTKDKG